MRKMMSVIFFGLQHVDRYDHINHVRGIVARWNTKSGEKTDPKTTPHEELLGIYFRGDATVKNSDPTKANLSYGNGVIFQTTYQDSSGAQRSQPTCFAFEDWLKEQNVKAALVLHQEDCRLDDDTLDEP